MGDVIAPFFSMCWGFFQISFDLFGYTLTLWQVFLFSVIAFGVAGFVLRLPLDGPGGGE